MSDAQPSVQQIVEGVLFVCGQPVALKRLCEIAQTDIPAIRASVETLNREYEAGGRAFQIQEVGGGYQFVTHQSLAPWIKRALQSPRPDSVSTAALETLAIIAYRQPITKAEIEAIRGVDVTASLDTLVERRFVHIAGRKESPGRPFFYRTAPEFLRHFGIKSIESLPRMALPSVEEQTTAEPAPVAVEAPDAPTADNPSHG